MLSTRGESLDEKTCLVSGSGNVAQFTIEKLLELGAKPVSFSDSSGYIYDEEGINEEKLSYIKTLKNIRRGRAAEYTDAYPTAIYTAVDRDIDHNPLWDHMAACAFPCATENEINEKDAYNMINNNVYLISEGANMPCRPEAIDLFLDKGFLYAPGKAANAGGVSVSGLEMTQNSMRLNWTWKELDERLQMIMETIHKSCVDAAAQYGAPGNYVIGANAAGFVKVADAMIDQGIV